MSYRIAEGARVKESLFRICQYRSQLILSDCLQRCFSLPNPAAAAAAPPRLGLKRHRHQSRRSAADRGAVDSAVPELAPAPSGHRPRSSGGAGANPMRMRQSFLVPPVAQRRAASQPATRCRGIHPESGQLGLDEWRDLRAGRICSHSLALAVIASFSLFVSARRSHRL